MIRVAAALTIFVVGAADSYLWPLDLPQVITSSFGEYRGGRFHAGLDLRTGAVGHPVKAPADGYVARIRCSPWGYGKALYLQLDDGHTAVFGHLDDFAPRLREYVRAAQHDKRSYIIDLVPEPGRFRVKRGEIAAFTGETGAGPAHLHYELRDSGQRPLNPRLLGISWPDLTVPLLNKIAVVPDGPGSRVNGACEPAILECRKSASGRYSCPTVTVSGKIGIGVDLIDPANGGANKLGIHTLKTFADGREVVTLSLDRFSYDESRYETVVYHPFLAHEGRFMLQWRWPDNLCGIYSNTGEGWIDVGDSPVQVRVEAVDFIGNAACAEFTILPEKEPEAVPPALASSSEAAGTLSVKCAGTWLTVSADFPGPEQVAPVLEVQGDAEVFQFRRVSERSFSAAIGAGDQCNKIGISARHPRLKTEPQTVHVFRRGAGGTVNEGDFKLKAADDSPYGALFVKASTSAPDHTGAPAPIIGRVLTLWPQQSPVDVAMELSAPVPPDVDNPARLAFYRRQKSRWIHVSTTLREGRLLAGIAQFGDYAIIEDNQPPVISSFKVGTGKSRPTITATVTDAASGVKDVQLTCNGQWLLAAYDPEADKITWERDHDLPPPPWTFQITATDESGNTATLAKTLDKMVNKQ